MTKDNEDQFEPRRRMTDLLAQQLCDQKHKDLDRRMETMEKILAKVSQRPSWAVSVIITLLCTITAASVVALYVRH